MSIILLVSGFVLGYIACYIMMTVGVDQNNK